MAIVTPKINQISRRNLGNPIVQIILFLLVLVLFSWFILKPKIAETTQRRSELSTLRQQKSRIEDDKREMNELINKLRASGQDVELIDEALPLSGRVSKVHVLLDNLVRSSGMELAQISAAEISESISAADKAELAKPYQVDRQLKTIEVSASFNGTMDQFRNLLQLIETNGRVLDVTSMEILSGEPTTQFRINVKAYAYDN